MYVEILIDPLLIAEASKMRPIAVRKRRSEDRPMGRKNMHAQLCPATGMQAQAYCSITAVLCLMQDFSPGHHYARCEDAHLLRGEAAR